MPKKKNVENTTVKKNGRATYSGLLKDKARTMARMVAAVGKVLKKHGYVNINAGNVAQEAGVDKRLVYSYFGGLDPLIQEFLKTKDVWSTDTKKSLENVVLHPESAGKHDVYALLENLFTNLKKDKLAQKIMLWEISEPNKQLRGMADERELMGENLFKLIDPHFDKSDVNIRATLALLISGLYYLTLHSENNGSTFCGIDIKKQEGVQQVLDTMKQIVFNGFENAKPVQ